jgi:hypothetical protein
MVTLDATSLLGRSQKSLFFKQEEGEISRFVFFYITNNKLLNSKFRNSKEKRTFLNFFRSIFFLHLFVLK